MSNIRKFIASLDTEERELLDLLLEEEGVGVSDSLIIPQKKGAGFFPLSFAQERLWFLNSLTDESTVYNGSSALRLKNRISLESLQQAFTEIVRRHDVLRTTFHSVDGRPIQIISPSVSMQMPLIDLSEMDLQARDAETWRLIKEELSIPFDLSKDLLLRTRVLRLDEEDHVVISSMHHIACDGWSTGIYVADLAALYAAFSQGCPSPLIDLPIRYADFAVWQREQLNGEFLQKQLDYWRKQLADIALLQMPTDRPRPALQTYSGAAQAVELDGSLIDSLENLNRLHGVTMFMTLLAAFKILLYRYSGQKDIVVGSLIAGRNRVETEGLIGFFANGLALRTDLSGDPTFEELLVRVQQVAHGAYAHQDLPFERVIEEINPERDLSHTPLFQIVFQYDITPASDIHLPGLILQPIRIDTDTVQYDLILDLGQSDQGMFGEIVYNTDLFDAATIERFTDHFKRVLHSVAEEPRRRLSEVPMLTPAEQTQLLVEWNTTRCDYPDNKCFPQLFEEQVERTPDAIAAVFENEQLTYAELNCRANKVARYLRTIGVAHETMVGICLERSLEMAVGLIGILKSQGVYIPLDPVYPRDRLAFMLEDSEISVLLTQRRLINGLPRSGAWALCLDTDWSTIDQEDAANLFLQSSPDSLAYGYYTSGSTGRPKGALVSHRAMVNYITSTAQHFELNTEDRVLQFASFGFDVVVEEVFTTWLRGAAVVFQDPQAWSSPRRLLNIIEQCLITVLELPAAFFHELVYELSVTGTRPPESLRLMIVGCEKPSPERLALWQKFNKPLIYVFGLTETAVTSTLFRFDIDTPNIRTGLPIGKPIANTQIYLLDAHCNPVPVGVPAELYIGGIGLGRGYYGNPDTTAGKFVPDPFSPQSSARLYKTGDMARYLPDGNIDFLGRLDNQVKLRGYRIELGEIETVLSQHPNVREAVALVREDNPGDKRLVAYVVAGQESLSDGHNLNRVSSEQGKATGLVPSLGEFPIYDELLYFSMTADEQRNASYRFAISKFVKDKTVLDIGTGGDAVLARFCVEAGARKVYAIERLDEGYNQATACIKRLGLEDKITLIKGDSIEVELPERVNVCVSELIGSIGSSEGVVAYLNDARRRFLKSDGKMIPQRCITRIAAVSLSDEITSSPVFAEGTAYYLEKVFDQVGYKFDVRLCIKNFSRSNLLSDVAVFEDLDFSDFVQPESHKEIRLNITRDAKVDGFLLWIDLQTEECESLDSLEGETSWLPVYFPALYPGIEAAKGDVIEAVCSVTMSDNNINPDYRIKGSLIGKDGRKVEFDFESFHHKESFKKTPLHEALFASDSPKVYSGSRRAHLTSSDLRVFLRERLPEYMVPAFFVILDTLPLTSNGKVDYQALPQPDRTRVDAEETQVKQKNPFEEILAGIWSEVFGLSQVGLHDNFFSLGGHSLLALQVVSRVRHAFQIDLPQRSLFESPTVAELAERIEAAMKSGCGLDAPPLIPVVRSNDLPLSFAQQRLWFINQLEPDNYSYNIPEAVRLKGVLKVSALMRALMEIVRRHESFRTTFSMVRGRPVQQIHSSQSVSLPIVDLTELPTDLKENLVQQLAQEEVQIPFNLASGPLFRVTLLKLEEHDHAVLLTIHHIIGDPWSMEVLVRELAALYQAFSTNLGSPLPELSIQYADFALWQKQWLQGEVLEKQLAYWQQNLSGRLPQLKLPTDRPRPATRTYRGAAEYFRLPVEVAASLYALSREAGITVFMTTLAAFQTLLHRYSGQDDIIVGSGIANRTRTETEQLIGYFVNTLVLRSDLSRNPTFKELLGKVKEMMLGAYAHQELPFELLVEALQPERIGNYNPLFQVWFEFQPALVDSVKLPGLQLSHLRHEWKTAQFDLLLSLFEYQDTIQGFLVYSTDLFDSDTVVEMLERYVIILEAVSSNPELRLLDIPLTIQDTLKYDNSVGLQRPGVTEDRFIFE